MADIKVRKEDLSQNTIERLAARHYERGKTPEQAGATVEVLAAQGTVRRLLEKKKAIQPEEETEGAEKLDAAHHGKARTLSEKPTIAEKHAKATEELNAAHAKVRILEEQPEATEEHAQATEELNAAHAKVRILAEQLKVEKELEQAVEKLTAARDKARNLAEKKTTEETTKPSAHDNNFNDEVKASGVNSEETTDW